MPSANINGVQLNYVQLGDADGGTREDLIMVHGLATNMAFWYFKYARPLAMKFRVTLYDLRGHGRSEMPPDGYSPAAQAQDLAGLMDHLGVDKAHFLAHSFGGVVTLNFACRQPQRVSSLALADVNLLARQHLHRREEWADGRRFQPLLDRHGVGLDTEDPYFGYKLLKRTAQWQCSGYEVPAELVELVSPLLGKSGKRTSADWLKLLGTTSAEAEMMGDDGLTLERLRTLRCPILAMYGDQSHACLDPADLLAIWPQAVFRRVRGAGHFFPTTRDEETLAECVRFWRGEATGEAGSQRTGESGLGPPGERVFMADGAWYFTTRECERVGPFCAREEASEELASFLSAGRT